jgi:hypothetical protein
MGAMLRLAIRSAGLPLAELGERAQVSDDTLRALGAGRRRTRRSTLGRICFALAKARPELGDPKRLADELAAAAGPALAPESPYAARIARRRERRFRRRARERELARERAERAVRQAERARHRRQGPPGGSWPSRSGSSMRPTGRGAVRCHRPARFARPPTGPRSRPILRRTRPIGPSQPGGRSASPAWAATAATRPLPTRPRT